MKAVLEANPEAVRLAGEKLAELAELLRSGEIDRALALVEQAGRRYPEWDELDRVTAGIDRYIERERKRAAIERAVVSLAGRLVGMALRGGLPL